MEAASTTQAGSFCPQHPEVSAPYVCARCQQASCIECCFSMPDGSICCKTCWAQPAPNPSPAPASSRPLRITAERAITGPEPDETLPRGAGCVQHPNVRPAAFCKMCGAPSCLTCNFAFPGGQNYCPVCVVAATRQLSPQRKKYLITAFALAACASLFMILVLSGAAAGLGGTEAAEAVLGTIIILLVGLPALIGTAMAMSAMRKGATPVPVWAALGWNSLLLGAIVVMSIIGNMME